MSDITIEMVPTRPILPVNDDAAPEYGSLNYIFYPGYSEIKEIVLTNTTGGALTPTISFKAHETDSIWWETMRISDTNTGVLADGVFDQEWSGAIGAGSSKTLYIYSHCTKEGFSNNYDGTYWTNSGFAIADMDYINDREEQTAAVDCDAAAAGSTLMLDLGADTEKAYVRIKFSTSGAAVNATFDIQYSDDNVTWATAYTGADLSVAGTMEQITFWWDNVGAHRYWRIYKTDAAAAGGDITDIQWLLFDAHKGYEYGVYGDHKCYIQDEEGYMDDFELRTSIMVNIDVFSRQNYQKPIGRVSKHTDKVMRNFEKYGQTIQLYYIPTMTFSADLNATSDFQLEKRIWDVKAFIAPQKRSLTYIADGGGLEPNMYRYDQRSIYLEPYGPDKVGWYQTNYDFWHAWGHSYYVLFDNHCYKIDDPQPVYLDDELIAFTGRMFLQTDMASLTTDPRNYILTNREGLFMQFYPGGFSVDDPEPWMDPNTPEQRNAYWIGAYIQWTFSRTTVNRPNPYSLTADLGPAGIYNGEVYNQEVWNDPAANNFTTSQPVAFGVLVDAQPDAHYWQMPRFYNWIGYVDYNSPYDTVNTLIQLYLDEDCTIPVEINLEEDGALAKVEWEYDTALVAATGEVTLTALGGTVTSDGHTVRTPSKLYVRYIPDDGRTGVYYPQ